MITWWVNDKDNDARREYEDNSWSSDMARTRHQVWNRALTGPCRPIVPETASSEAQALVLSSIRTTRSCHSHKGTDITKERTIRTRISVGVHQNLVWTFWTNLLRSSNRLCYTSPSTCALHGLEKMIIQRKPMKYQFYPRLTTGP